MDAHVSFKCCFTKSVAFIHDNDDVDDGGPNGGNCNDDFFISFISVFCYVSYFKKHFDNAIFNSSKLQICVNYDRVRSKRTLRQDFPTNSKLQSFFFNYDKVRPKRKPR